MLLRPIKCSESVGLQPSGLDRFCENHRCYTQCNYWGDEPCSSSSLGLWVG